MAAAGAVGLECCGGIDAVVEAEPALAQPAKWRVTLFVGVQLLGVGSHGLYMVAVYLDFIQAIRWCATCARRSRATTRCCPPRSSPAVIRKSRWSHWHIFAAGARFTRR